MTAVVLDVDRSLTKFSFCAAWFVQFAPGLGCSSRACMRIRSCPSVRLSVCLSVSLTTRLQPSISDEFYTPIRCIVQTNGHPLGEVTFCLFRHIDTSQMNNPEHVQVFWVAIVVFRPHFHHHRRHTRTLFVGRSVVFLVLCLSCVRARPIYRGFSPPILVVVVCSFPFLVSFSHKSDKTPSNKNRIFFATLTETKTN